GRDKTKVRMRPNKRQPAPAFYVVRAVRYVADLPAGKTPSILGVAKAAGIAQGTAKKLLSDPDFPLAVESYRYERTEEHRAFLRALTGREDASIADNPISRSDADRLAACVAALNSEQRAEWEKERSKHLSFKS